MSFNINRIIRSSLCLGCGLCEAVGKQEGVKMTLNKHGFYEPHFPKETPEYVRSEIKNLCPGIHIECIDDTENFCGKVIRAYKGWSTDPHIRRIGSSGGVITGLACFLLEKGLVSGVLQIGKKNGHYLDNELRLSKTKEDILSCSSSRYAPALVFDKLPDILKQDEETFLFIGKPCDVMTLKKYIKRHPEYDNRIKYYISLVCAGMPGYNATRKLISLAGNDTEPVDLRYRGDGWPGNFHVRFGDGKDFNCSYNESWGKVLGRDVCFRCKICADGIGQYADIVVGDAWETTDGYPDFTERDGQSFLLTRTDTGEELIRNAIRDSSISAVAIPHADLEQMQPYQYMRLHTAAYKLIPAYCITKGLIRIRRMKLKKYSFIKGCRISAGTVYRYYKRKK